MESYSIDKLTPTALTDIIEGIGGGMVQAIILAAEIVDKDGSRRNLFIWDNESGITIQLGLRDLLSLGLEMRAEMAITGLSDEDFEDIDLDEDDK